MWLGGGDTEHAHSPGADMRLGADRAGPTGRQVSGDDVVHQLPAGTVGDIGHLHARATRKLLPDEGGQRLGAAGTDAAGIRLRVVEHAAQAVEGLVGAGGQHHRVARQHGDRREIADRVIGQGGQVVAVHHMGRDHHEQGVPIRLRTGHHLGADDARRACPVLDDERLRQARPQRLADRAGQDVGAAARGIGDDDAHRARRPGLRLRQGGRRQREASSGKQEGTAGDGHDVSSLYCLMTCPAGGPL